MLVSFPPFNINLAKKNHTFQAFHHVLCLNIKVFLFKTILKICLISCEPSQRIRLHKEPITKSLQLPHIPVTASVYTCMTQARSALPCKPAETPTIKSNSRPGQYLTHAHSHITRAVAAMDSCFGLVRPHQHGIAVGQQ